MKTKLIKILLAVVTSLIIAACADEAIKPVAINDPPTGGTGVGDRCQFGGPGCP